MVSNPEESPPLSCVACKQSLPPLEEDLKQILQSFKLGKTTEDILCQHGVQHLEEILELSKQDLLVANMTLLQVRLLP